MIELINEQAVVFARSKLSLDARFCDLQWDGLPPADGPEYYIAINDGGCFTTNPPEAEYINEEYRLQIAVWMRAAVMPNDRLGSLLAWTNRYQGNDRYTLGQVSRLVIKVFAFGDSRWEFRDQLNDIINADTATFGDCIRTPLRYIGTSAPERYTPIWFDASQKKDGPIFIGRRIVFAGLSRLQGLDVAR